MFKQLILRLLGLEQLQKSHDLRAALNNRLSKENARLRKELSCKPPQRKLSTGAQEHISQMTAAHSRRMQLLHLEGQRQNIITDLLRDYVSDAVFFAICDDVRNMTEEQVAGYVKPKRPKAGCR